MTMKKAFALVASLFFLTNCQPDKVTVNDYYGWCSHALDSTQAAGLELEYNYKAIRQSYVNYQNQLLAEEVLVRSYWDTTIDINKALNEHQLGMWLTGNVLHVRYAHFQKQQFYDEVSRQREVMMMLKRPDMRDLVTDYQKCNALFFNQAFEKAIFYWNTDTIEMRLLFEKESNL